MTSKKPLYLALDSDILRTLTFLHVLKSEHGFIDRTKIHNKALKDDFNYFINLYNAINCNEIRPLIVDAVYQESKHSPSLVEFIKQFCYFPNVNAANYQEKAEKARKLANAYTKPYTHTDRYDGKEKHAPAPMKSVFIADINKYVPTNDCYIMAQATIENCPLLTGNGKDFIFNQRNEDKYAHERVNGIIDINILNGYYKTDDRGNKITTKPIMINTIAKILKYENCFENIEQLNDYIKADTIL